ncbi:hypothetical protein [Paraburkholderia sabiae]|uniref:hypothetical protein n=1 Tax=Paraburkholderia sabiae TaxID=273251 RepID=UPI001CC4C507|nr:hypothetical protein [Paraburkholderia sabiae]
MKFTETEKQRTKNCLSPQCQSTLNNKLTATMRRALCRRIDSYTLRGQRAKRSFFADLQISQDVHG